MTILERAQISIERLSSPVIMRSELSSLGSPSQLSKAFNTLVANGHLIRISVGMYAKSKQDSQGTPQFLAPPKKIVEAVFKKLGMQAQINHIASNGMQQIYHVHTDGRRISRKFTIGTCLLKYENTSKHDKKALLTSMPDELDKLPITGVSEFVERFASAHNVEYARSGLDDWAEAVTQASGDSVKLDKTSKLLITLKKRHLIDGQQLARLITNLMKETEHV